MEDTLSLEETYELLEDGYAIYSPELAEKICQVLSVKFNKRALVQQYKSDPPDTVKGLTMRDGFENSDGADSLFLSQYIAEELHISANIGQYSGRGFQARANVAAIKKAVSERGVK